MRNLQQGPLADPEAQPHLPSVRCHRRASPAPPTTTARWAYQYEFYFCETTSPAIKARIVTDRSTSRSNGYVSPLPVDGDCTNLAPMPAILTPMTWFSGAGSSLSIAVTHNIIICMFRPHRSSYHLTINRMPFGDTPPHFLRLRDFCHLY
jgi:hypothetical protein